MTEKTHLGANVFAEFDGVTFWLTTDEGARIAIPPSVLRALNRYSESVQTGWARGPEQTTPATAPRSRAA